MKDLIRSLQLIRDLAQAESHRLMLEYERWATGTRAIESGKIVIYPDHVKMELQVRAVMEAHVISLLNHSSALNEGIHWIDEHLAILSNPPEP